jgi:hypothetical protein
MVSRMLAALALASVPLAQQRAQEPPLHAKCIWVDGDYQAALDGLMACGDEDSDAEERALKALREHAKRHGWCGRIGGNDLIPPDAGVPCPQRTLDLFVQIVTACAETKPTWVQQQFADVLARNGRVDDALTVLNFGAHARPIPPPRWHRGFFWDDDRTFAAFDAANIAAQAGRWAEALQYSQEWHPSGGCGNCMAADQARMNLFRAECLVHLQRWSDVRTACIDGLQNDWTSNPDLAEPWIDSYVLSGELSEPEVALEELLGFTDPRRTEELEKAMQRWKLVHQPKAAQMKHIAEIAASHSGTAFRLILDAEPETIDGLLDAFEVEDGRVRNWGLVYLLAETGLPVVGEAIARAPHELDATADPLKYERQEWESAHEQREMLANQ